MSTAHGTIGSLLLFALAVGSGLWLSHLGRPLNDPVFAAHKLVALAAVIVGGVLARDLLRSVGADRVILLLIIVSVLSIAVLFVTGAVLSTARSVTASIRALHTYASAALVSSAAIAYYLLAGKAVS